LPQQERAKHTFGRTQLFQKGSVYHIFQDLVILLSTVSIVVASVPEVWSTNDISYITIEVLAIICFSIDYFARLITTSESRVKWIFHFTNMIDFFSIFPAYIQYIIVWALGRQNNTVTYLTILRVLRLAQVIRVLKLAKHSTMFMVLIHSISKSLHGLYIMLFLVGLETIVFSSAMFYAEQSISYFDQVNKVWRYTFDNSTSPFQSIPATFWWAMVTITTVGYGDMAPVSVEGKIIACFAMLCAILAFAFPITIIGAKFSEAHTEYWEKAEEMELKQHKRGVKQIAPQELQRKLRNEMKELKRKLNDTHKAVRRVSLILDLPQDSDFWFDNELRAVI